jgi:predicted HTH domain antitoxin
MLLSLELPDLIAHSLRLDGPSSNRRALEMLALEGYREGMLSRGQVSEMLNIEFNETERFLLQLGADHEYSIEDFRQDSQNLRQFLAK